MPWSLTAGSQVDVIGTVDNLRQYSIGRCVISSTYRSLLQHMSVMCQLKAGTDVLLQCMSLCECILCASRCLH